MSRHLNLVSNATQPQRNTAADQVLYEFALAQVQQSYLGEGIKKKTIKGNARLVERMTELIGLMFWLWDEEDFTTFCAHFSHLAITTQGKYQSIIHAFFDRALGCPKLMTQVHQETGIMLRQICHSENMITHRVERETTLGRRSMTPQEIRMLLDAMVLAIADAEKTSSKSLKTLERDLVMYYLSYVGGLRSGETRNAKLTDFAPHPDRPEMGPFATLRVFGKASKGSPKKLRHITLLMPELRPLLEAYLDDVRPCFVAKNPDTDLLFLSERGNIISPAAMAGNFQLALIRAGLEDRGLCPHSLRHSFVTHLQMIKVPAQTVQKLVGHTFLSTTQAYTDLPASYHEKTLNKTYQRSLGVDSGDNNGRKN